MKRPRFSVRLMLLAVALFAILFAWIGAQRQMERQKLRARLDELRHVRRYVEIVRPRFASEESWHFRLTEVDAEIARLELELGIEPE